MRRRPLAASVIVALACVVLALGVQSSPDLLRGTESTTSAGGAERRDLALSPPDELEDATADAGDDLPLLGILVAAIVLIGAGPRQAALVDRAPPRREVVRTDRVRPRAPPSAPVLT